MFLWLKIHIYLPGMRLCPECGNGGSCDPETGLCVCPDGFIGLECGKHILYVVILDGGCVCVCVCVHMYKYKCVCVLQHVTLISVDVRCVQPDHEALSKHITYTSVHIHVAVQTCSKCSPGTQVHPLLSLPLQSIPFSFLHPSLPLSLLPSFPPPHSESCSIPDCTQCIIQDGKFVCQECKEDFEVSGDDKCERKYL